MALSSDQLQRRLLDECEDLHEHVKLLRDYATTPDNVWLARGELNRIGIMVAEIESLLSQIKEAG